MNNVMTYASKTNVITTMMIPPAIQRIPCFDFLTPSHLYIQTPPLKEKDQRSSKDNSHED